MFDNLFSASFWLGEAAGIAAVSAWALIFAAIWAGLEHVFPFMKGGLGD